MTAKISRVANFFCSQDLNDGTIRVVLASKNNNVQRKYQPIVFFIVKVMNAIEIIAIRFDCIS